MKILTSLLIVLACLQAKASAAVQTITSIPYSETVPTDTLDFYLPDGGEPKPLVLFIHGGGWMSGAKDGPREVSIAKALSNAGFAVASLDYRLATTNPWPAQLDDINAAIRFLTANADKYHLDPNRFAVFGGSAGGHLALMAAYTQQPGNGTPKIRAVVAFYPITNLLTRRDTDTEGKSQEKVKESTARNLLGCTLASNEALWKSASPASHVTAEAPPTFLAHGQKDTTVNWEQTSELAALLEAAHVPHEVVYEPSAGHTFDLSTWKNQPLETDLTPLVLKFLQQNLQ